MKLDVKTENASVDMTPMIDIAFLLIAFFMILVNFTEADQNERIKLPYSELAIPPESPPAEPLVVQMLEDGNVIFGGNEYTRENFKNYMATREIPFFNAMNTRIADVTVILRADARCPTGMVRDVIEDCHELKFVNIKYRAKQRADDR